MMPTKPMMRPVFQTVLPGDDLGVPATRDLILEYASELGRDLYFQGFQDEVASLPGKYIPPDGYLLLAYLENEPAAVGALRRFDGETAELKRFYTRPNARGKGLARTIAETCLNRAKRAGYRRVVLDTLPKLEAAVSLYKTLGFEECEPYYDNPMEDVRYFSLSLVSTAPEPIDHLCDYAGRLTAWPLGKGKAGMHQAIREYMSDLFEPGRSYSESQVNQLLESRHAFHDPAMLRRELVDHGYLVRDSYGREYRKRQG
ncbi:MAG: GNAT family N-acetyltransferase [Armatimonadetes bacterium]|nr:GNAT family N-acetyltransferase [Armatimonadota bacterium]